MNQVEIPSNFVGDFKVGYNIVYNCNILCKLVAANEGKSFYKLIVLQVGSILEAAISQIIYRAKEFNREGVPSVSADDQAEIKDKKIDKFAAMIDVMRKYGLLDGLSETIYEDLHKLRKYRNKIHIQEGVKIEGISRDEDRIFTKVIVDWALDLNRRVLEFLNGDLARPTYIHGHVPSMVVPIGL